MPAISPPPSAPKGPNKNTLGMSHGSTVQVRPKTLGTKIRCGTKQTIEAPVDFTKPTERQTNHITKSAKVGLHRPDNSRIIRCVIELPVNPPSRVDVRTIHLCRTVLRCVAWRRGSCNRRRVDAPRLAQVDSLDVVQLRTQGPAAQESPEPALAAGDECRP